MALIGIEWWYFEILIVLAGLLGEVNMAAEVALQNMCSIIFLLSWGIGIATASLVGNSLGENNPNSAKRFAMSGLMIELIVALLLAIIVMAIKDYVGYVYSQDAEVVAKISYMCWIFSPFIIIDGMSGALSGVVRGLGKQLTASVNSFISFYIVGLPILIICSFGLAHWELYGLWGGTTCAITVSVCLYSYICIRADWPEEARKVIAAGGVGSVVTQPRKMS